MLIVSTLKRKRMVTISNEKYLSVSFLVCTLCMYSLLKYINPMVIGDFPTSNYRVHSLLKDILVATSSLSSEKSSMNFINNSKRFGFSCIVFSDILLIALNMSNPSALWILIEPRSLNGNHPYQRPQKLADQLT